MLTQLTSLVTRGEKVHYFTEHQTVLQGHHFVSAVHAGLLQTGNPGGELKIPYFSLYTCSWKEIQMIKSFPCLFLWAVCCAIDHVWHFPTHKFIPKKFSRIVKIHSQKSRRIVSFTQETSSTKFSNLVHHCGHVGVMTLSSLNFGQVMDRQTVIYKNPSCIGTSMRNNLKIICGFCLLSLQGWYCKTLYFRETKISRIQQFARELSAREN